MRRGWLVLCVSACVSSDSVECQSGLTCPVGTACDEMHDICVDPDQLTACGDLAEAADCMFDVTSGKCTQGVCLVPECGNNIVDVGEACDVGDTLAADGCSADCLSNEACGNSVVDLTVGEACDDGNRGDHDGCTSTCQAEGPRWIDLSAGGPTARAGHSMAYDPTRDQILMFGGYGDSYLSDTWLWRGSWQQQPSIVTPPNLAYTAAAYHHELGRVVVAGGETGFYTSGSALAWDGTTWTPQGASDGPARTLHNVAYDPTRKRLVLFGGLSTTATLPNDTWEFDGTAWTQIDTPTKPSGRTGPAMTYDPEHNVVLMYGGLNGQPLADLWAYDGTDWTLRGVSPGGAMGPAPLRDGSLAYDVRSHRAILFGGETSAGLTTAMWSTPGTPASTWTQVTPINSPVARAGATMVADAQDRLVLFAGRGTAGPLADTWIYDGVNWIQSLAPGPRAAPGVANDIDQDRLVVFGGTTLAGTFELSRAGWRRYSGTQPAAVDFVGMVYDETHRNVVAFGGTVDTQTGTTGTNETWLWKDGVWNKQTPGASPGPARFGQLIYDSQDGRVLAFGPSGLDPQSFAADSTTVELWSWNGTTWNKLTPSQTPPPRFRGCIGYDRVRRQAVMFGGTTGSASSTTLDDTWVFENGNWREVTPPAVERRPPPQYGCHIAWNPSRGKLTLVDPSMSAWEWLGTHWEQVATPTRPPPRDRFALAPARDGIGLSVLFGYAATGLPVIAEWQLRWDGTTPADACARPVDLDGDALVGCADSDCWHTCSPRCSPGMNCPADAPRCGDGACTGDENCFNCTADCTCPAVCGDFYCAPAEVCPGDCP